LGTQLSLRPLIFLGRNVLAQLGRLLRRGIAELHPDVRLFEIRIGIGLKRAPTLLGRARQLASPTLRSEEPD
jgi:hypothetical protein